MKTRNSRIALIVAMAWVIALPDGVTAETTPPAANSKPAFTGPETIGDGTVDKPALGPAPAYDVGGAGMVLVKNWHFGKAGTIKNYDDLSANFFYHDQFGTIGNGTNYGAHTVAHDKATALPDQPVEGVDSPPVREFFADSMKTYLTGLDGATLVKPKSHNAGCGSFMAKWKLPKAKGPLPERDLVWETRVRYKTPPYYWFAIWTAGNKWKYDHGAQGAEHDLVEGFGYDNGNEERFKNFDGRYWHANSVATPMKDTVEYKDWGKTMATLGIKKFEPGEYHTWTWQYNHDGTYAMYMDGIKVQSGSHYFWTYGGKETDEPIDTSFLFDGGWGHTQIDSVCKPLPVSAFEGKFYEWQYSRVYLRGDAAK